MGAYLEVRAEFGWNNAITDVIKMFEDVVIEKSGPTCNFVVEGQGLELPSMTSDTYVDGLPS